MVFLRLGLALALLISFAFYKNTLFLIRREFLAQRHKNADEKPAYDPAQLFRFRGIKKKLPRQGTFLFLSDFKMPFPYYLAQYALAPRIIVRKKEDSDFVIAYFSTPKAAKKSAIENACLIEKDYGNRVYLFRRIPE